MSTIREYRSSELAYNLSQFPFLSVYDHKVRTAYEQISSWEGMPPHIQRFLQSYGDKYIPFLATNLMFTNQHDGLLPARIATLAELEHEDVSKTKELKKHWGLEQYCTVYAEHKKTLEELAERIKTPDGKITPTDLAFLKGDTTSLKVFALDHIKRIARMDQSADPSILEVLPQLLAAGAIAAHNTGNEKLPESDVLAAMATCVQDIHLKATYPALFTLMNTAVQEAIAVSPDERYNVEFMSQIATESLARKKTVGPLVAEGGVRVIGRVKSLSSHLKHATKSPDIATFIKKMSGLPENQDSVPYLEEIFNGKRYINPRDKKRLQRLLCDEALLQYDKLGCRIQVADPDRFDKLVHTLHLATAKSHDNYERGKLFHTVFGRIHKSRGTRFLDYFRLSDYEFLSDGSIILNKKNHEYRLLTKQGNPSHKIAEFIAETFQDHLRYAALHGSMITTVTTDNKGRRAERPVTFEYQLTPWQKEVQDNFTALNFMYHSDTLSHLKIPLPTVNSLRLGAIGGVQKWGK